MYKRYIVVDCSNKLTQGSLAKPFHSFNIGMFSVPGLLGGAALGYGASKILGHGFGGWGLGRHGSWGSISSYGSAGSFGSFD